MVPLYPCPMLDISLYSLFSLFDWFVVPFIYRLIPIGWDKFRFFWLESFYLYSQLFPFFKPFIVPIANFVYELLVVPDLPVLVSAIPVVIFLVLLANDWKLWCLLLEFEWWSEAVLFYWAMFLPKLLTTLATSKYLGALNFLTTFYSFDFWIRFAS